VEISQNAAIGDILMKLPRDKEVQVHLRSGETFDGTISKVTMNLLVLKLRGERSFYDATIRLEDVSAFEVKARS
jgi:hypothetical protein